MKLKKNILFVVIGSMVVLGVLLAIFIFLQNYRENQIAQKFYFGDNLLKEEKWEEAGAIFEEIFKNYPRSKKAIASMFYYAFSLEKLGRNDEAYSLLVKIREKYSDSPWVAPGLLLLAKIEKKKGRILEAEKLYEKIINEFKTSSFVAEAWLALGEIYEGKGEFEKAQNYYECVINNFPQGDFHSEGQKHLGNLKIKMIFSSFPSLGSFIYKVSSGDTLAGIARRFNTTVDLLKESNQIESSGLSLGRRLKITPGNFNILVSKSKNILELRYNDELIKSYSVATGKSGSTPVGDFKITNKLKNPDWFRYGQRIPSGHPDNILGSRWLGLSEAGYGIHGTTQPETIGKQSTDGCVRMLNEDVEELYKLVTIGTSVKIID